MINKIQTAAFSGEIGVQADMTNTRCNNYIMRIVFLRKCVLFNLF